MHQFCDMLGRPWTVEITVGSIRRVLNETGVNLLRILAFPGDENFFDELSSSPGKCARVLACLCSPENKENFCRFINANSISSALGALIAALREFFPSEKGKKKGDGKPLESADEVYSFLFELAGIANVSSFEQYTLRELLWIAEGRESAAWDHTASLLAQKAEMNRDEKKRFTAFSVEEFHPYLEKKNTPPVIVGTNVFKGAYGNDKSIIKQEIAKAWDKMDKEFFDRIEKKEQHAIQG